MRESPAGARANFGDLLMRPLGRLAGRRPDLKNKASCQRKKRHDFMCFRTLDPISLAWPSLKYSIFIISYFFSSSSKREEEDTGGEGERRRVRDIDEQMAS